MTPSLLLKLQVPGECLLWVTTELAPEFTTTKVDNQTGNHEQVKEKTVNAVAIGTSGQNSCAKQVGDSESGLALELG